MHGRWQLLATVSLNGPITHPAGATQVFADALLYLALRLPVTVLRGDYLLRACLAFNDVSTYLASATKSAKA